MSSQNISCLENDFWRLDTLNSNHITDGITPEGMKVEKLFTCDEVSML